MRYALAGATEGAFATTAARDAIAGGTVDDATQMRTLVSRIDRWREAGSVVLVLDGMPLQHREPFGAEAMNAAAQANADASAGRLFRDALLPRADLLVSSRREAVQFFAGRDARRAQVADGASLADDHADVPHLARRLRAIGVRSVCITDMRDRDGRALAWLDTEEARGWLMASHGALISGSRSASNDPVSPHGRSNSHGHAALHGPAEHDRFVRQLAAALARGFVAADAAVLATLAAAASGRADIAAWQTSVPVASRPSASSDLPLLSWGETLPPQATPARPSRSAAHRTLGLYAIVDSAQRLLQVLQAGVQTVQLRIKAPPSPGPEWQAMLRCEVQRSIAACHAAGAELFINDHWMLARELGMSGVHLGQEDLLALGEGGRGRLRGLALGISSHSLWELCRAAGLGPRYIACGPVWPTLTKAMPWRPQGLANLAWWCRMAPAPVVAIGGVLEAQQVRDAAACGADGVCIVRGLGENPTITVPALQAALDAGRAAAEGARAAEPVQVPPAWPHPSLARSATRMAPR